MTATVDVIVDHDDHVATTRAIHALAAREPTVLPVAIPPDYRPAMAVIWAILRALGKRSERLGRETPQWHDARKWLAAHAITELVILQAQHLRPDIHDALIAEIGETAAIHITLVHGGTARAHPPATLDLNQLLRRQRREPAATGLPTRWPAVPSTHPLRRRYDCSQQLEPEQFARVDELLNTAYTAVHRWIFDNRPLTRRQLGAALSLASWGCDPNHGRLRASAVAVALACIGIPKPRRRPLPIEPRELNDSALSTILARTDPARPQDSCSPRSSPACPTASSRWSVAIRSPPSTFSA